MFWLFKKLWIQTLSYHSSFKCDELNKNFSPTSGGHLASTYVYSIVMSNVSRAIRHGLLGSQPHKNISYTLNCFLMFKVNRHALTSKKTLEKKVISQSTQRNI